MNWYTVIFAKINENDFWTIAWLLTMILNTISTLIAQIVPRGYQAKQIYKFCGVIKMLFKDTIRGVFTWKEGCLFFYNYYRGLAIIIERIMSIKHVSGPAVGIKMLEEKSTHQEIIPLMDQNKKAFIVEEKEILE